MCVRMRNNDMSNKKPFSALVTQNCKLNSWSNG